MTDGRKNPPLDTDRQTGLLRRSKGDFFTTPSITAKFELEEL